MRWAVFLAYAIFFLNFRSIYYVLAYNGGGGMRVTGENHYLMEQAYDFMLPQLNNKQVLLTDYLSSYDELFNKRFVDVNKISFLKTVILGEIPWTYIVSEYPEGWIVLTPNSRVEKYGFIFEDETVDGKLVDYIGKWGECYIWHWSNP